MSSRLALLRQLEPVVRPVPPVTGATPITPASPRVPFEQQNFADLMTGSDPTSPVADSAASADPALDSAHPDAAPLDPLQNLADVRHLGNPSLRQLLADARTDTARSAPPSA